MDGQKGYRHESRKPANLLSDNFGFCWFIGYTF